MSNADRILEGLNQAAAIVRGEADPLTYRVHVPAEGAGENGVITGYMCLIDYEHELGHANDGNKVYPSIEALKRAHPMWKECGVVEVTVRGMAVVVEQDLLLARKNAKRAPDPKAEGA